MESPEPDNVIPLRLRMGRLGPDDTGERVYLQGFDAVFRRYHPYITTVIYRIVVDRALTEDLTQETFMAAYRGFESLDRPEALRSWLCTIAVRLTMRHMRRQRKRPFAHFDDEAIDIEAPGATEEERAFISQIFRHLGSLDAECKTCWVLSVVEGFSNPEIVELTGLSESTVKRRVSAAKKELERHMDVPS